MAGAERQVHTYLKSFIKDGLTDEKLVSTLMTTKDTNIAIERRAIKQNLNANLIKRSGKSHSFGLSLHILVRVSLAKAS